MLIITSVIYMNKVNRQSNIELLRIILMMFVITLHFNFSSNEAIYLASGIPLNQEILYFLEALEICAVNTFVLITGYFMCTASKIRLSKILFLIVQVSIYRFAIYLIQLYLGLATFSYSQIVINLLPNNWFTSIYVALYLLAPFINKLIKNTNKKQFKHLIIISFILFSVAPFVSDFFNEYMGWDVAGLNTVSFFGANSGYSIVNFVLMYLIGAYLRMNNQNKLNLPILGYILCAVVIYLGYKAFYVFHGYCNPFVILEAVALFKVFEGLNIKNNRIINTLSKQSYSVYLLHGNFYFIFNIESIVSSNPVIMLMWIIILCITLYMISWFIGTIYDFVTIPIQKLIKKYDVVIEV